SFLFINSTDTSLIYTLSLHDALPIYTASVGANYHNQNGTFDNDLEGLVGLETYQRKTYGDDVTVDLNWLGALHIIPSRLVWRIQDRKSTRLNSSHVKISYAVFCLKKK